MTNTLIASTSYPLFSPNQVLSDRDLNLLVTYLESQNRLSRHHFMGMGIACGLQASATYQTGQDPTATITISPGSGITSEGYVVSLPQSVTLTHYQEPQEISASRFQVSGNEADSAESNVLYAVTELFSGQEDNLNRQPLHTMGENQAAVEQILLNHILVILCEFEDTSRDSCLLDCDDLGRDRNFNLRYLLLPKTLLESETNSNRLSAYALLQSGYAAEALPAPWTDMSVREIFETRQSFFQHHSIQVPRFGYDTVDFSSDDDFVTPLLGITDYPTFVDRYRVVCEQTIDQLGQVLPHVAEIFSPFFSSFQPQPNEFGDVFNRLTTRLQNIVANATAPSSPTIEPETQYTIQYFYDYLVQVVAAYDELVHTAFDLVDDCLPDIRRFPKFLMLGSIHIDSSADASADLSTSDLSDLSDPYRNHFVQPPLYNQNHQRRRQVRHLYDRLVKLCAKNSFYPLPFYATPVQITPSCDRALPLSEQAIPYYLNYPNLYQTWNYDAERKGLSAHHPAYFLPTAGTSATRRDLRHRLDAYSFYRIEGHLGKDKDTMLAQLRDYRQRWNLAFDIVTLKIGDDIDPNDSDVLDVLAQEGRLEAINQDFAGIQQIFQTLWAIYEADWSENVFLNTLKSVFFDQPSFLDITLGQLDNPVLATVRSDTDDQYRFEPVLDSDNQATGRYRLMIARPGEDPLARVVFQQGDNRVDSLNLSVFSGDDLTQEQNRITGAISTALIADQITYGLEPAELSEGTPGTFLVTLSLINSLQLPVDVSNTAPTPVRVIILSEDALTVETTNNGSLVTEAAFQDYETLYGLLRDLPEENTANPGIVGNRSAALDYIRAFYFPERIKTYRTPAGQTLAPQLFSEFAQRHPGLDHLGGVPEGGTFILAYADDTALASSLLAVYHSSTYQTRVTGVKQTVALPPGIPQELDYVEDNFDDWTNIVVADYCLPYRLGSQIVPATASHSSLDLPPVILLIKTNFCADDETLYDFLLYPHNGQLKGEGSFFANGKYSFQPSGVFPNLQHDVAIAFSYAVDGSESSLIVTINPLPDASFQLGKPNKTVFCTNDEPVPLIPCIVDGTFTAFEGDSDTGTPLPNTILENNLFYPDRVDLGTGIDEKVITIKHTVTNEQKNCTNSATQTITIYVAPSVDFQILDGENTVTQVCANVAFVTLSPNPPNGLFRVLDGNHDISSRLLQGDRLLPSAVNLGGSRTKPITVEYGITDARGCTNQIRKSLTILALPDAGFQIGGPEGQTTFCEGDDPVVLTPNEPAGTASTFTVEVLNATTPNNLIAAQAGEQQFFPARVLLNNQQRVSVRITHAIRYDENDCENRSQQTVTVVAKPNAEFRLGESNQTDFFSDDPAISLIPNVYGGQFSVFDGEDEIVGNVISQSPYRFDPNGVPMGTSTEKEITLKYEVTLDGCSNESDSQVIVRVRPEEPDDADDGGDNNPSTPGDSEEPPDPAGDEPFPLPPAPIDPDPGPPPPVVNRFFSEAESSENLSEDDPDFREASTFATEDFEISPASASNVTNSPQNLPPLPEPVQPPDEPLNEVEVVPPITSDPPAGFGFPGRPNLPDDQPPQRESDPTEAIRLIRELRDSLASLPVDNVGSEPEPEEPDTGSADETEDTTQESSDELPDNSNQIAEAALDVTDDAPSSVPSTDEGQTLDAVPPFLDAPPQTLLDQNSMNDLDPDDSEVITLGNRLLRLLPPYGAARRPTRVWTATVGAIATALILVWVGTAVNNRARVLSPVNVVPSSSQSSSQ